MNSVGFPPLKDMKFVTLQVKECLAAARLGKPYVKRAGQGGVQLAAPQKQSQRSDGGFGKGASGSKSGSGSRGARGAKEFPTVVLEETARHQAVSGRYFKESATQQLMSAYQRKQRHAKRGCMYLIRVPTQVHLKDRENKF